MDINLSRTFSFLRFPLAVLVVFRHVLLPNPTMWDHPVSFESSTHALYFYAHVIIDLIANCAVPCFFIISGYLIAMNVKDMTMTVYKSKLRSRFQTLLIPYVLWNLIFTIILLALHKIDSFPGFSELFLEPKHFALWYVRNLIVFTLIFPIFLYCARHLKIYWVLALFAFYSIQSFISAPFRIEGYTVMSVAFYQFGVYAGLNHITLNRLTPWRCALIVSVSLTMIALMCLIPPEKTIYINNLTIISITLAAFAIAHLLSTYNKMSIPAILVSSSFFIYLFHICGPTHLGEMVFNFLPDGSWEQKLYTYLFTPLIATLICVGTYMLLNKFAPRLLSILTGGKIVKKSN